MAKRIKQEIDVIDYTKISDDELFENYISKRIPVIIDNYFVKNDSKKIKKTFNENDDYESPALTFKEKYENSVKNSNVMCKNLELLKHHLDIGDYNYLKINQDDDEDQKILVEQRNSKDETYGKGNLLEIGYNEFIDEIFKENNNNLYLSASTNDNDLKLSIPCTTYLERGDLNLDTTENSKLFSNLIIDRVNCWIGNTGRNDSSKTPLHHDFHDNFYFLLSGEKYFRLISPFNDNATKIETFGKKNKIHANGVINYQKDLRDDHVDLFGIQSYDLALKELKLLAKMAKLEDEDNFNEKLYEQLENEVIALQAQINKLDEQVLDNVKKDPENFCKSSYLNFTNEINCQVKAGQVLYLPAGYFHEVKSKSIKNKPHVAFNFWLIPPPGSKSNKKSLNPYRDDLPYYMQHIRKTIDYSIYE